MTSTFALPRNTALAQGRLAPPREGHWLAPVLLALLAHGLLVVALTWGVGWKQDVQTPVFEAELWARLPVEAAPRAEAPPPALPQPAPVVPPQPRPAPPSPGPSDAEIATQRAQKKKEELQRQAEQDRLVASKAAADKAAAEKKKALEQQKAAEQKMAQDQRAREEAEQRQKNIDKMLAQAGASGGTQARGAAQQSAGPSTGYGARVKARIKPNVVFTDDISGNPRTEVEVRTLPDGTIVGRRIVKPSGNPDWDEAALKAIDRTGTLPRDTDGRVPPSLIIVLQPKD